MQGPEDSPQWKYFNKETDAIPVEFCHKCGSKIQYWHCTEAGCPWCNQCVINKRVEMETQEL